MSKLYMKYKQILCTDLGLILPSYHYVFQYKRHARPQTFWIKYIQPVLYLEKTF